MTWILVRHGQTEWNLARKFQGQKDSALTSKGEIQVHAVAHTLAPLLNDHEDWKIFVNPLGRAQQTLGIIRQYCGLAADSIVPIDQLMECNYGDWAGLTSDQVRESFHSDWCAREADKWNYRIPGGESYSDLHARIYGWMSSFDYSTANVIVVAHEMVNRTIRGILLSLDPKSTLQFRQPNDAILLVQAGKDCLIKAAQQGACTQPSVARAPSGE